MIRHVDCDNISYKNVNGSALANHTRNYTFSNEGNKKR